MRRDLERLTPSFALRASLVAIVALTAAPVHADVAQGPMVQAVTDTQAGVWLRTQIDQPVRVSYWGPDNVTTTTPSITTLAASDDTARFMLTGLLPGSTYTYQVGSTDPFNGIETWTGNYTFKTVRATVPAMTIAVLADFRNRLAQSAALQSAITARPDLLAVIGDLDHRDPAKDAAGQFHQEQDAPVVLADLRSMHRDSRDPATVLGANFHAGIVGAVGSGVPQIPMVYAWDDHDFCANNTDMTCPFAVQASQAYNEYYILAPDNAVAAGCGAQSDFESLRYGQLIQLFFLDVRSGADETLPDGDTAMLGACQHEWLVNGLRASQATWKIVLSPVTFNPTMKTWDGWGRYANERARFLSEVWDVPNLVFVTGDVHSGGAIDEGAHSGFPEVSTPHAGMPRTWVNTFCRVQNGKLLSRPGSWSIGSPIDPNIGVHPMNCLAKEFADDFPTDGMPAPIYPLDGHNNPGYTWINATSTSLTISVRNANGNVKQGFRADGSAAPLKLKLTPD